jgi:hypothetical protein
MRFLSSSAFAMAEKLMEEASCSAADAICELRAARQARPVPWD